MRKRLLDTRAVKAAMAEVGYDSIAQLAADLGRERSYVSRVIGGVEQRPVPPSMLLKLSDLLDKRPHALIRDDETDALIEREAAEEVAA